MATKFSSAKMSAAVFQPVAMRVTQPTFTAVAAVETAIVAQPVKAKEVSVPVAGPVFTTPIQNIRFIDPAFAQNIINLRTPTGGVPRGQINVPVSPSENVTDELIFEGASDPSLKFYIPRYRLAEQSVGGQQRYQVALRQSGEEWTLTVHLQKYRAPSIAAGAPEATEMNHRIAVFLKHNQLAGGTVIAKEELELTERTDEPNGICAVLRGNNLAELGLIYQTLTDPVYGATFIVRNWVTVAVPVPRTNEQTQSSPTRIIRDHRTQSSSTRIIRDHRTNDMAMSRMARFEIMRPVAVAEVTPAAETPTEPLFRQVDRVLDDCVAPNPFVFPPALHGYIFGDVTATSGERFELVRHQVTYPKSGRSHSYYQNPVRSYEFYYLPDAFKIVRLPQSPHKPTMSVRFATTDASIDAVQVSLDYIALPFVDPARLQAAASELKQKITEPLPPDANGLDFEPLLNPPDKTQLLLAIPRSDASSGPFDDRKGAMIDLRSGIHDSLSLNMSQFQAVYDALFGGSINLLSGNVVMNLGGEQEAIPFAARMDDLIGEVFSYEEFPDEESGGLKISLKNAIESPIIINALNAEIRRGEAATPGQIRKLVSSENTDQLPVELKPGKELRLLLVPSSPLPGAGALHAVFDLTGIKVQPDKDAVWNAILDDALAVYPKLITVKTFKQNFDPPPDNADNQIMAVVVDFEGGVSVELNADKLEERDVPLPLPIGDYVLRKADQGQYRYKVRVIRLSGETRDTEWRTDSTGILFPSLK
ncbi:MAG TPA: hypothetical protein VK747_17710 [Blastocatellia bacterium]|nr:hypothetical protein [Blastocatellia bacterium]